MKNSIKKLVKEGIDVLKNPANEFKILQKKQLEDVISHYLKLLLLLSIVAFLFNLTLFLARTIYFRLAFAIDIDYLVLFNYMVTESFTIAFSYITLGIFLTFVLSVILRAFFKKIKYTELLKIILYSMHPLLLFSWTPYLIPSLLVWSVFLFCVGITAYKPDKMAKTNKHKLKSRLFNLIVLAMIIVCLVIAGSFLYQIEFGRDAFLRHKLASLDLQYMSNSYIYKNPNIGSLPFYGSPNASITLIAYLDTNSESSKFFINEIFPRLDEEFISNGKLKYYQKNYITEEDYIKKTNRFIYVKSLFCVLEINKDVYYDVYFDMVRTDHGVKFYAEKYNIPDELLNSCMVNQEFDRLREDISEIRMFGMLGMKQRFYIGVEGKNNKIFNGVPSYTDFQESIRRYLFRTGVLT